MSDHAKIVTQWNSWMRWDSRRLCKARAYRPRGSEPSSAPGQSPSRPTTSSRSAMPCSRRTRCRRCRLPWPAPASLCCRPSRSPCSSRTTNSGGQRRRLGPGPRGTSSRVCTQCSRARRLAPRPRCSSGSSGEQRPRVPSAPCSRTTALARASLCARQTSPASSARRS